METKTATPRLKGRRSMMAVVAFVLGVWVSPAMAQRPGDLVLEPFTFVARDGTRIDAETGTFFVPENRSDPDSSVIALALVRLPSTSISPGPPVIYLAGGPGGSGIEDMRSGLLPIASVMREFGDVIALDQRGTGESQPNLACRRKDDLLIPADEPFDPEATLSQLRRKSKGCVRWWRKQGVDLDGYNSNESADDLDELRRALGEEELILWGESYGTHLSLATIRRHPERVAKAVLFGVEGPNHTVKLPRNVDKNLKALATQVRKDSVVGPAMPDLVGTLERAIVDLNLQPQAVDTASPSTGGRLRVTFGGEDLRLLFAQEIADDQFFVLMPRLLAQAEAGDYRLLAELLASLREPIPLSAMTFAMDCASGVTRKRWKKVRRQARKVVLGRLTDYPFPDVCDAWQVRDLGDGYRSELRSDVRTLFISGTLDGRTPVSNATEIGRGMRSSEHLVIEGSGHNFLMRPDPRLLEVVRDFLSGRPISDNRFSVLPLRFDPI